MSNAEKLGEAIQRYGYNKKKKIKLYGKKMELVSDPVNPGDDKLYVEARAEGTEERSAGSPQRCTDGEGLRTKVTAVFKNTASRLR